MTDIEARIAALEASMALHEQAIVIANDAAFAMAGIICRIIVEAGLVSRTDLADAVAAKAGDAAHSDHNAPLLVFSRALRMNLPGGTFELLDGGLAPRVARPSSQHADDPAQSSPAGESPVQGGDHP